MSISDRTLMAAALGVLDPGDARALARLQGTAEHLRQSGLAALADCPIPNDLAGPASALASSGVLGGTPDLLRPGDRLSFVLRWPDLPQDAACAVFRRVGDDVRRLYPTSDTWTPLSRFRRRDGHPLVELVIEGPPGRQDIDVVLVAGGLTDRPWPDGSPAWTRLHRAYRSGSAYGVTLEIAVC